MGIDEVIADMERLWVDNSMEKLKGTLPDDEVIEMMSTHVPLRTWIGWKRM